MRLVYNELVGCLWWCSVEMCSQYAIMVSGRTARLLNHGDRWRSSSNPVMPGKFWTHGTGANDVVALLSGLDVSRGRSDQLFSSTYSSCWALDPRSLVRVPPYPGLGGPPCSVRGAVLSCARLDGNNCSNHYT